MTSNLFVKPNVFTVSSTSVSTKVRVTPSPAADIVVSSLYLIPISSILYLTGISYLSSFGRLSNTFPSFVNSDIKAVKVIPDEVHSSS